MGTADFLTFMSAAAHPSAPAAGIVETETGLGKHIADSLFNLIACVHWLHAHGLTVLSFSAGFRRPRVDIECSARIAQVPELQGATLMRVIENGVWTNYMVAAINGCQVQWVERGN